MVRGVIEMLALIVLALALDWLGLSSLWREFTGTSSIWFVGLTYFLLESARERISEIDSTPLQSHDART